MFRSNYRNTRPVEGTPYRGYGRADDTSNSFSRLPCKTSKTSHDLENDIRTAVLKALQRNNDLTIEEIADMVMEKFDDDYKKPKQAQNGEAKPLTAEQMKKLEVIQKYYAISCRLLGLKKPTETLQTGRNTDYDRG